MPVSEEKRAYAARLTDYIDTYSAAFVVHCDNVGSKQMQQVRQALRGKAEVLMGKNVSDIATRTPASACRHVRFVRRVQTTIRKVIKDYLKKNEEHPIGALLDHMIGNVGLIFTNEDLPSVRDVVIANKVPAPARVGSVAPIDVFVEPGPTGCDPGQTSWFQALNIPTKINKGQIEMISRVHLVHAGSKVTDSQAALLQKLNIKPFTYGLVVLQVYQNGTVFDVAVLDMKEEDLMTRFSSGISTLAAASLGLGLPTKASLVHSINDAYKALISIALGTEYKFARAKAFEDFLANPGNFVATSSAGGSAAASGATAAAAKEEEKKEEEEEEVGGAGGLFGADDDW